MSHVLNVEEIIPAIQRHSRFKTSSDNVTFNTSFLPIVFAFQIAPNGESSLGQQEVKDALAIAGYKLPNHKVRDLLVELKKSGKIGNTENDRVSKALFKEICQAQKMADQTQDWKATKIITEDEAITHKSK